MVSSQRPSLVYARLRAEGKPVLQQVFERKTKESLR